MALRAGDLDQRITLQVKSVSRTAMGDESVVWNDYATTWAAAYPARAREVFQAAQVRQHFDVKFVIRHRAGVGREDRLVWKGQPYEIVGDPIPVPGGRPVYLEIMAVAGVRDGR